MTDINERITYLQKNLRVILDFKGMTHAKFAELLGCSRQHLSGMINGYRRLTKIQYLAMTYCMEHNLGYSKDEIEQFCTTEVVLKKKILSKIQ